MGHENNKTEYDQRKSISSQKYFEKPKATYKGQSLPKQNAKKDGANSILTELNTYLQRIKDN